MMFARSGLGDRLAVAGVAAVLCTAMTAANADDTSDVDDLHLTRSSDGLWARVDEGEIPLRGSPFSGFRPDAHRVFRLDRRLFDELLSQAPLRFAQAAQTERVVITIPMPDGTFPAFEVVEDPIMEPALAEKFPEMKAYCGKSIDLPAATVRFDVTPVGFRAQILSPAGAVYIDPLYKGNTSRYATYYKRDYRRDAGQFRCLTPPGQWPPPARGAGGSSRSGDTLRSYRLACAATGEYAVAVASDPTNPTVADAMTAIHNTVNRVVGIYEMELAVTMVLVANNDQLVYTDGNSDPYTNNNGVAMLTENQTEIDRVIGDANYDIGHVFSTGGGGVAWNSGVVCATGWKAGGVTGSPTPTGDPFDVGFVAHEMGHQFGAHHTFNGANGDCATEHNASTAYEPGSGSTIMAYAGNCGTDDLQANSDPYFHFASFDEIMTYITSGTGSGCANTTGTGNTQPTVNAGLDYTIPLGTPFTLTASGSDPDVNELTYCWEEADLGPQADVTAPDDGAIPLFRSFSPTDGSSRTFPQLSDILANTATIGEQMPATNRTLEFRVTARDNQAHGGGVNYDSMTVSVSGAPFRVSSPNGGETVGSTYEVQWDPGGINPPGDVNILLLLSTDSWQTFTTTTLLANTPNDGSQTVALPATSTTQARIMIEAAGNIFFDVSDEDFTIEPVPEASLPNLVVPLYEPDVIDPNSDYSSSHTSSYPDPLPLPLGLHLFTDFDGDAGAMLSYSNDSCSIRYDDWLRIDFDAPYFRSDPSDPNTAYHPNPGKIYILAAAINAFCDMGSWSHRVFGNLELEFDDGTTADSNDIPELELTAGVLAGDDLVNWIFQSGSICYTSAPQSEYSRLYSHGNYGLVLVTIPIPEAYQELQLEAITIRSDTWPTSHHPVERGLKFMGLTVREPQPYLEFKIEVATDPIDHPSAEFGLYDDHGTLLESWTGVFSGQDVEQDGEQVLNNPRFQYWTDLGPIPEGVYTVGEAGPTGSKPGVKWYPLTPKPETWMWGRNGFFIHPNGVSHGCIVLGPGEYGGYDDPPEAGSFRDIFENTPGVRHALENGFMELRVVYDIPEPPYYTPPLAASATGVGLASAASLLVTVDETGHSCGYFGPTGEAFCNIDGADYSGPDAEPQTVTMPNLADLAENYRVDLFPRYAGEYHLSMTYWPAYGSPTSCLDVGDTTPGLVGRYEGVAAPDTCSLVEVAPGDFNEDGNVDLADYFEFQECVAGPEEVYLEGCADGDLNGDGDVDLQDFGLFGIHFTGW